MDSRSHLIQQLETFSMSAWPALKTVYYDGWLLRFSDGYTRRTNSVNPIYGSTIGIDEKITQCLALFKAQGIRPVFKVTDTVYPADLDTQLEQRGYKAEATTSVQTVDLATVDFDNIAPVTLEAQHSPDWITTFARLNEVDNKHIPTMTHMLDHMALATAYATIVDEGEVAAVGLGVAGMGIVGLFDIVTAANRRNQGLGRRMVLGLLRWGREQGAQQGFLQVVADNAPAVHLYGSTGFREAYRYWYRA